jgi:hypothetical protein
LLRLSSDEFARVILRLEPLPCGLWVSSIVAQFRGWKIDSPKRIFP